MAGSVRGRPPFGRLAEVLLGSCAAAGALLWLGRRRGGSSPSALPAAAPSGALGVAAGLCGVLLVVGGSPYAGRTVALVAVAGALGTLAARRLVVGWFLTGALAALVAAWTVAVYANGWAVGGWSHPEQTAGLVATIAFVPLSACLVTAARRPPGPASLGTLAACLAWLIPATVPYALSWGPQLAVLLACLGVSAISRPSPADPR